MTDWRVHGCRPQGFSLTGTVISFLLVFRSKISYDRFWEGAHRGVGDDHDDDDDDGDGQRCCVAPQHLPAALLTASPLLRLSRAGSAAGRGHLGSLMHHGRDLGRQIAFCVRNDEGVAGK
eukprot:COSAG01_NODE_10084_length_2253_cov_2.121170_1_plen_119_part_10